MGKSVPTAYADMFPARHDSLPRVVALLERFCAATGIDKTFCLRLNLVLEELFINTVNHGHRGDCDAPVWVILAADEDAVHVTYEDMAPAFNPYARMTEEDLDRPVETRRIGGLGVLITRELSAMHGYAYLFGRNRIRLTFARQD